MAINLTTVFKGYTDELFSTESKKALITNQDFDWTGAHTVKVYKIGTSEMTDYDRQGTGVNLASGVWSRYGAVSSLDATTEEFTLRKLISWIQTKQRSSWKQLLHWRDRGGKS